MFRLQAWMWLCVLSFTAAVSAQDKPEPPDFDVKAHYTKYEYRIPMRDGVHLFTSFTCPRILRSPTHS